MSINPMGSSLPLGDVTITKRNDNTSSVSHKTVINGKDVTVTLNFDRHITKEEGHQAIFNSSKKVHEIATAFKLGAADKQGNVTQSLTLNADDSLTRTYEKKLLSRSCKHYTAYAVKTKLQHTMRKIAKAAASLSSSSYSVEGKFLQGLGLPPSVLQSLNRSEHVSADIHDGAMLAPNSSPSVDKPHDLNIADLDEFSEKVKNNPSLFEKLSPEIEKLKDALRKVDSQEAQAQIVEAKTAIKRILVEHYLEGEEPQALAGLKIVANLIKGFKVKRLLNGASQTQTVFDTFQRSLQKLDKLELRSILSREMRREAFRNIKMIKEQSEEILFIERQVKRSFPLSLFASHKLAKLEKTCQEISKIADDYDKELNFTADDVSAFQDLTVESRRPRRQHLLMYANDILEGARRLATQKKTEARQNDNYQELETKLSGFETKIAALQEKAEIDPRIGNGNLLELLASDKKEWKKQQEEAKLAIQEIFDKLKIAYDEMGLSPVPEMTTAETLTKARDDLLADKARWGQPIVRDIEFSGRGGKVSVRHAMTCLNAGYPSSSFRGREAGVDCIQPNLHKVDLKDSEGNILASYSSSATNVEFFQGNDDTRAQATLQQTGEILADKIENKLAALEKTGNVDPQENALGTQENPVVVDVLTTLLLSPDTIKEWLVDKKSMIPIQYFFKGWWVPKDLSKLIKKEFGLNRSQIERKILKESLAAWMAFDKGNTDFSNIPNALEFKDKDGNSRTLSREQKANGETVFAFTDAKGEKTYVQFEISCYNVGCNKWTQLMTNGFGGQGIEKSVKKLVRVLNSVFKAKIPEFSGDKGQLLGQSLEDDMNAKAFAKDTKRYNAKLIQLDGKKRALLDKFKVVSKNVDAVVEVERKIQELREARKKCLGAEVAHQYAKGGKSSTQTLDAKRKEAFREWQAIRQNVVQMIEFRKNRTDLSDDAKEYLKIIEHEENLRDLFDEISDQFRFKDYRTQAGMDRNMYTLPSTLVAFGIELEADPHTGCRSGKDRTSMQRLEVGTKVFSKKDNGRYLNYRELEEAPETFAIREQMLLNSGHIDDLARLNTGSSGLNMDGAYGAYLKHIGSDGTIYSKKYERSIVFGAKGVFSMKLK